VADAWRATLTVIKAVPPGIMDLSCIVISLIVLFSRGETSDMAFKRLARRYSSSEFEFQRDISVQ